jgi:hypothetical protein
MVGKDPLLLSLKQKDELDDTGDGSLTHNTCSVRNFINRLNPCHLVRVFP